MSQTQTSVITDDNIHDLVSKYVNGNKNELPPDLQNIPIGDWNVSKVTNMDSLFADATSFNEPLNWNVFNVTNMNSMFYRATSFNQPLNDWNVFNVENMYSMFDGAISFNQPLNKWNVSNVKKMDFMFANATSFNQPLNNWDVHDRIDIDSMFDGAISFNPKWRPGEGTKTVITNDNIRRLVENYINGNNLPPDLKNIKIGDWDVSKVTNMKNLFYNKKTFNEPLNNWNVFNVKNMESMFQQAIRFNQPLNKWDVSNVKNMENMFYGAISFDQNPNWNIGPNVNIKNMFKVTPIETQMLALAPKSIKIPIPIKNINNKMDTLENLGKGKFPFYQGLLEIQNMFYLYLIKKYKSNCSMGALRLGYDSNEIITKKLKALVKCIKSNSKVIIIPITDFNHANMLIYRNQYNQIEHFEPYGSSSMLSNTVSSIVDQLNNILIKEGLPKVSLIKSNEVCSRRKGLQTIEESTGKGINEGGGYCAAWSMFFAELCLKNPEIPSSKLLQLIFNKLDTMSESDQSIYLSDVIRGYAIVLNNKICKYFSEFFELDNITVENLTAAYHSNSAIFKQLINSIVEIELEYTLNPSLSDEEFKKKIREGWEEISDKRLQMIKNMHLKEMSPTSSQRESSSSQSNSSSHREISLSQRERSSSHRESSLSQRERSLSQRERSSSQRESSSSQRESSSRKSNSTRKRNSSRKRNSTRKNV